MEQKEKRKINSFLLMLVVCRRLSLSSSPLLGYDFLFLQQEKRRKNKKTKKRGRCGAGLRFCNEFFFVRPCLVWLLEYTELNYLWQWRYSFDFFRLRSCRFAVPFFFSFSFSYAFLWSHVCFFSRLFTTLSDTASLFLSIISITFSFVFFSFPWIRQIVNIFLFAINSI